MTAVKRDLYIEQGASFDLSFQWRHPGVDAATPGDPRDLTGWVFRMQVRKTQQTEALVDATTANGKIIVGVDPETPEIPPNPLNGWVTVSLSDEDTDLLTSKTAFYDLEAESPAGKVYRLLQGKVNVDPNITQESTDPVVTP